MRSAPAPNAHRPVRRLRYESFKNNSFFCVFPQPFQGIFESPVAKNAGNNKSVKNEKYFF
jgi:hypothetical protein